MVAFVTKITISTITTMLGSAITAKNLFKKPKYPLKVMLSNYRKPYTTRILSDRLHCPAVKTH